MKIDDKFIIRDFQAHQSVDINGIETHSSLNAG